MRETNPLKGSVNFGDTPVDVPAKPHVVIVGTMFGSKTVHGPFDSYTEASKWADDTTGGQHYEIVPLLKAH